MCGGTTFFLILCINHLQVELMPAFIKIFYYLHDILQVDTSKGSKISTNNSKKEKNVDISNKCKNLCPEIGRAHV